MADELVRVESFPFDSVLSGYDDFGYPVYDRAVGARTLGTALSKIFTDGVFGTPADALQIGKAEEGLAVTVNPGVFIIEGRMGGVWDEPVTITLEDSAPQGKFAYALMLRYDNTDDRRSCYIRVAKSTASSSPVPPSPESGPSVREYRLGYVVIPNGATDMTGATVTNEKGTSMCPYTSPFEEIDLSEIVEDARNQAQEVTDAFLVYAKQYYDLIASAIDDTTAGYLMEMINNISAASFVDNVTLNLNGEAKAQIKSRAVKDDLIAIYGIHSEHMDNYLRQLLGILDPSSWSAAQFIEYVSDLGADDQTSFINGNMTGDTIADWTSTDVSNFDAALKSDAASTAFANSIDINLMEWGKLDGIVNGFSHAAALSSFVGKEKQASCGTYGTQTFRVIGVKHDDLSTGGKAALTFECTTNMVAVGDTDNVTWDGQAKPQNDAAAWPICSLRTTMRETVLPQFPSDMQSAIKTVKKRCTGGQFNNTDYNTRPDDSGLTKVDSDETVFLLSAYEIYGPNENFGSSYTVYWAPPEGDVYDYWSSRSSQAALNDPQGYGSYYRWTRSWAGVRLVAKKIGGAMGTPTAGARGYAAPAFCI